MPYGTGDDLLYRRQLFAQTTEHVDEAGKRDARGRDVLVGSPLEHTEVSQGRQDAMDDAGACAVTPLFDNRIGGRNKKGSLDVGDAHLHPTSAPELGEDYARYVRQKFVVTGRLVVARVSER